MWWFGFVWQQFTITESTCQIWQRLHVAIVWCGGGEQGSKHTGNDSSGSICSQTPATTERKYQGTDASKKDFFWLKLLKMKCINKGTEKKPWVELTVWELPGTSSWWNIGHIEPYNMVKNSLYLLNQGQEFAMYCTMYPRYFPACIVWKWSRKCTYHSEGDGIQFHVCHNIFLSNI